MSGLNKQVLLFRPEWTQDPWRGKDEYKTGHKISPWQIQYKITMTNSV